MKNKCLALLLWCSLITPAFGQKPSNIQLSGGIRDQHAKFLSVSDDGSKVDLWFTDDGSGRQQWVLQPGTGGHWFNVIIRGGMRNDRKYLSVTSDGSKVDLFNQDDGSGRQRWVIEKLDGGLVHIRISGGVEGDRRLLGITSDGRRMELFPTDDGSGRERWKFSDVGSQASAASPAEAKQSAAAAAKKANDDAIPVVVDAFTFGGNSARYRVTNGNRVALTAYAIQGARPSGQPWTHVDDFRIAQSDPLATGQSHLGENIWNTFEYPRGIRVTAAIFADGTSKGDSHVLESLIEKRKEQLFTFASMSRAICEMAQKGQAVSAIQSGLAAKKAEFVHTYPGKKYVSSGGEEAYSTVTNRLTQDAKTAPATAVRTTLNNIHDQAARLLLDPVRDASGKLVLQDVAPPENCHLK